MLKKIPYLFIAIILLFSSGCSSIYKGKSSVPILLRSDDASKEDLIIKVNKYSKIESMRVKMDFKFEDTQFAQKGTKESYITANADFYLQRPANISLKVGLLGFDGVQMTSNGEKFRVAILNGGTCGEKCKKFIFGTNNADYSVLQNQLKNNSTVDSKEVSSFANLRPQHFTDALMIRPTDSSYVYLQSTIFQIEGEDGRKRNSRQVTRPYYLLDELKSNEKGELQILRRFWFDRNDMIRLARQQIFDAKGEIETDVAYWAEGKISNTGEYNLPTQIILTRPKDKYSISLNYQSPDSVQVGKNYPEKLFQLENTWHLPEIDLDKQSQEPNAKQAVNKNQ